MKRYLIILTLYLCAVIPTMAQYYSVNYDKRTVAEMTAAFATEAATEAYYAQQVAKIREHYQAAEVAAAGIFTSKFLDRKALTNLGLWTSATENYYYRRIYNMVSAKIMPKIWTVAGMMLKINPAKRNVLDLKNETCKNREKRNGLKISHTRHFKITKKTVQNGLLL